MNQKLFIKRQFLILLLLGAGSINAQLGVGTLVPNNTAMLYVECSSRGLLIPRVILSGTTDNTTITNGNVESLLVYNTQTINDFRPGHYYWNNNTSWVRLLLEEDIPDLETTTTLVDNGDGTADVNVTLEDVIDNINTIVDAQETITKRR